MDGIVKECTKIKVDTFIHQVQQGTNVWCYKAILLQMHKDLSDLVNGALAQCNTNLEI